MRTRLNIALIGAGAMGRNHARIIEESQRARIKVVIDPNLSRAWGLAQELGCSATGDPEAAKRCDAAIIASATDTHVELAFALLAASRPLLVEKPVSVDPDHVRKVISEAQRAGVPLMCGFVERFNPVIPASIELMEQQPLHIVGVRHSPATPRATMSVVYDLLIHDVDLAMRLAGSTAVARTTGAALVPKGREVAEAGDCVLQFRDGLIATLSASRTSQKKIRQLYVETPEALFELDLLRQDIAVYRHVGHQQLVAGMMTYRAETIVDIPFVRHSGEPLALQFNHFLNLIDGQIDAAEELESIIAAHEVAAQLERHAIVDADQDSLAGAVR
jgi:predicted dehydrogenase